MAGKKLTIHSEVRASTILEVVVSMVIIIVVFGIAMMIYSNVLRLSLSEKKIRAQAVLQQLLIQAEQTKNQVTQSITIDDLRIDQEVKPYLTGDRLSEIDLTAYDTNQEKITELKKVIINK